MPYVKQIVGIDISQGMVDLYNRRVDNQGLSSQDMQAKVIDLEGGFSDELQTKQFNFVVVSYNLLELTVRCFSNYNDILGTVCYVIPSLSFHH
jgi:ubiquinone/menaquinone biosynthesis C-methylase UbiE